GPGDRGKDDGYLHRAQLGEHRWQVLVLHRAEDNDERSALRERPHRCQRALQTGRIVSTVNQHNRMAVDYVEAAGPAGPGQAVAQGAVGDVPSPRTQTIDGGDRQGGVLGLMKAEQRYAQVTIGIGWRRDGGLDARPFLVDGRHLDLVPQAEERNL